MSQIETGEAFKKVIQIIEEYVESVEGEVEGIFEEFYQLSLVDNQWEALYNTGSGLERVYNEEVLMPIKEKIVEWSEGDGSYVQLTKRFHMGDEATNTATIQQNEIINTIENINPIEKFASNTSIDFSNTTFELESIKVKLEDFQVQAKAINEIVEEKSSLLNSLSEENGSVKTIVAVGIAYGHTINNFVSKVTTKIAEFISNRIDIMNTENESAIEADREIVTKFNQEIEDSVNEMHQVLEDIFE